MHKMLTLILLTLQLGSFLFILLTGPVLAGAFSLLLTQIFAIVFSLWAAYLLIKKSKFSPFPEVHIDAKLIIHGPYEYIRHPVYSGMILFALTSILYFFTLFRLVAFLIFIIVILFKLHLEEEYLSEHFGEYKKYQESTKKLIPFLY